MFGGDMLNMYNQVVDDLKKAYKEIDDLKQELQRKDNIINELKKWLNEDVKVKPDLHFQVLRKIDILDKIKELEDAN